MPYSRVGIMPEVIHSKDAKGSRPRRGHRSKGITMEDLKKQTALRLAQENSDHPLHQEFFLRQQQHQQSGQLYPRNLNSNNYGQHPLQHVPPQDNTNLQQYIVQHPGGYMGVPSYNQMNGMPSQDQNLVPPVVADNRMMAPDQIGNYMPHATRPLQPTSPAGLPPNTMYLQHQQQFASYAADGNHFHSISRNDSNTIKHKLPHGLTVHELKEMTKARLQSEAFEKSTEYAEMPGAVSRDRVSPLDFDAGEPIKDRTMSRDSSSAGRINGNQVTSYSVQHQQASPKMIQTQGQPQLLTGVHLGGPMSSSFRIVAPRKDTWDSTSVASHNSTIYSDNLGSETASDGGSFVHNPNQRNRAFASPIGIQSLDITNSSGASSGYKESRSFSNPSPVQASPHRGAGLIGGHSLFNAAVGGNRRRAVTLSPNNGSILEDRPFRYDSIESGDRLEIPSFSSGLSDTPNSLPTQNLNRGYSPVLEQLGLGLDNSCVSNGTERNNVFRGSATKTGSALPGISQMSSMEEEIHLTLPSNTNNNSSVFRPPSAAETKAAAPPPGFTPLDPSPRGQIAFSRVASMDGYCNRNRKSSWDPSKNHLTNISDLSPEATLVADFGSLLDLSGSDRRDRERASTYTFGTNQSYANKSPNLKDFPPF